MGESGHTFSGYHDDATQVGWTASVGFEHAFSDRFSVRLEYAHIDFGRETIEAAGLEDKVDASFDAVKVGVSYKLTSERETEPLKASVSSKSCSA